MNFEDIKILIVDDEIGIRRSLSVFLEDEGMSVVSTASGKEALDRQDLKSLNLAIVDIRMPELSGDELIKKLHEINKEMKFIVYTGSQEFIVTEELSNLGLREDAVLYKPLKDLSILSELIKKLYLDS